MPQAATNASTPLATFRTRIRATFRPLAFLLLGALLTLATAWLPAAFMDLWPGSSINGPFLERGAPPGGPAPTTGRVASLWLNEYRRTFGTSWEANYSTNPPYSPAAPAAPFHIPLWIDPTLRPWATTHDGIERPDSTDWPSSVTFPRQQYAVSAIDIRAYGWPMLALYRVSRYTGFKPDGTPTWSLSGAVELRGTTAPDRMSTPGPITLPLHIRPAGLIFNTLFWAAASWLIVSFCTITLQRLRTRRRFNRGLCTACGYSRAGLATTTPCPECGHALP